MGPGPIEPVDLWVGSDRRSQLQFGAFTGYTPPDLNSGVNWDDPVAFWEHRGPPNDGNVITGIRDHVYSSRCLDEGAPGRQFLRRAMARTNEVPFR